MWSTATRTGLAVSGVDALIQSDGGFPGDVATLSGVPFPTLIAHSDVDLIFPIDGILREFEALPSPKFLLLLHGVAHAAVGENTPTPADDAYRLATTTFWDRYLSAREAERFSGGHRGRWRHDVRRRRVMGHRRHLAYLQSGDEPCHPPSGEDVRSGPDTDLPQVAD